MKAYTDVFKKPITKEDVQLAVRVVVTNRSASPSLLQRQMKIGYGKASTLIQVMEDAQIIGKVDNKPRTIILGRLDIATNAALRQLNKGRTGGN